MTINNFLLIQKVMFLELIPSMKYMNGTVWFLGLFLLRLRVRCVECVPYTKTVSS